MAALSDVARVRDLTVSVSREIAEVLCLRSLALCKQSAHGRAVGHFQHIGHMAGGGRVEKRDILAVVCDVQHLRDERSCIEDHRLSRFEIYLAPVSVPNALYTVYKQLRVVIVTRNVVTAAEIYPLHAASVLSESAVERVERDFKRVRVLLAQRVKVQSVE